MPEVPEQEGSLTPNQLVQLRQAMRLSQIDLARALGVAANTVNRWEAGTRAIPPYLTLALAGIELRTEVEHLRAAAQRVLDGWDDNLPTQEDIEVLRVVVAKPSNRLVRPKK